VTPLCEYALFLEVRFMTSCFLFSAMDGKIEQRVCIKFCEKLGKSAMEILEMLHETFGEHSLSRTAIFERYSRRLKTCRMSVEYDELRGDEAPAKRRKILKKIENSSMKTADEYSMSSETPLGSVMDIARRS
jgi:hypothetical protein